MKTTSWIFLTGLILAVFEITVPEVEATEAAPAGPVTLTDQQVENIVRRSYQYVALYNVNNKFALKQGGWNTVVADMQLKDHTLQEIARPNNDTLYIGCMLDLRHNPVILEMPAFDSQYVSLMVTAYDHYMNVPMSTRLGDSRKLEKMLFYSARAEGYNGEPVKSVDRIFEASGDFISAIFCVMPHGNDPDRFSRIVNPLAGEHNYTLTFGKDAWPPADAFWSSTLCDVLGYLVNNPWNCYALSERSGLSPNPDGSLTIYIQAKSRGERKEANWLPASKAGSFKLAFRLYTPRESVREGKWVPPAVKRNDGTSRSL